MCVRKEPEAKNQPEGLEGTALVLTKDQEMYLFPSELKISQPLRQTMG